MARNGTSVDERDGFYRPHVNAGLAISVLSVVWTVLASTASIVVGVRSDTAVLVAFGAIGIVDAVGSVALSYHFHHALRHDALSDELEGFAHKVVLVGLSGVGSAAIVGGLVRLAFDHVAKGSNEGVVLAAVSLAALMGLSARKQQIARRVSSAALRSDGHLSAIGAMQAAVTLAGTVTARWLGWTWVDAVATSVVGCVALSLAIATWRTEQRSNLDLRARLNATRLAVLIMFTIAVLDALLGPRLILIGALATGPTVAVASFNPRRTALITGSALTLATLLGAPDHIWLTTQHLVWIAAIAITGGASTVLLTTLAAKMRAHPSSKPSST